MPDYVITVRRSTGWTIVALMIIIGVLTVAGLGASAQAPAGGGSTTATLNVVATMRSVIVSPVATTFARCSGGMAPLRSTPAALGYPNGRCSVGKPGAIWPITIRNGLRADIFVQSSNAVPSDGLTQWRLCNMGPDPAVACKGPGGLPGKDQFVVENFSRSGQNSTGLADAKACDAEFNSAGGCLALTGQSQHEGIALIGPSTPDDNSTSWTITITWIAVPPT